MLLSVGRVTRAHGVRGEVLVDVRTDDPESRFAAGATLRTDPPDRGPLTVVTARRHSGRYVLGFSGVTDRSGAETLCGIELVVDSADLSPPDDPDEFNDTDLLGMRAHTPGGEHLGELTDVIHGPGGDLLVVRVGDRDVLVPFVRDIVPSVDLASRRVVIDPPEGLLQL